MPYNQTQANPIYLMYVYKKDLALNNLQWLPQTKPIGKKNSFLQRLQDLSTIFHFYFSCHDTIQKKKKHLIFFV